MKRYINLLGLLALSLCLCACSTLSLNIKAIPALNPDVNGLASPLSVNVYQLSAATYFDQSAFLSLYLNAKVVLGPTLLSTTHLVVTPGEITTISLPITKNARYLGVVAAYCLYNTLTTKALTSLPILPLFGAHLKLYFTATGVMLTTS